MRWIRSVLMTAMVVLTCFADRPVQSQAIKKWKGRYPDMNNNYPMAFIAFKGWLPPIPHLFVRLLPTHYYYQVIAIPALDAKEFTGQTQTSLMRLAARMWEQREMNERFRYMGAIQEMTGLRQQMEERLFNARSDELADVYATSEQLSGAYELLDKLPYYKCGQGIKNCFEEELDDLVQQFLLVNGMQSGHGPKLEAFNEIQAAVWKLTGEVNYTISKLRYLNAYGHESVSNYVFLTR